MVARGTSRMGHGLCSTTARPLASSGGPSPGTFGCVSWRAWRATPPRSGRPLTTKCGGGRSTRPHRGFVPPTPVPGRGTGSVGRSKTWYGWWTASRRRSMPSASTRFGRGREHVRILVVPIGDEQRRRPPPVRPARWAGQEQRRCERAEDRRGHRTDRTHGGTAAAVGGHADHRVGPLPHHAHQSGRGIADDELHGHAWVLGQLRGLLDIGASADDPQRWTPSSRRCHRSRGARTAPAHR